MIENILIDNSEISAYLNENDFSDAAKTLLNLQLKNWNLAANGFDSLKSVQTKVFDFDEYKIKVQFNPGRMVSSSAKVDEKSIKERECFLCLDKLPAEQKGILINGNYLILVNPFPIFPEHFTIPNIHHVPQRIKNSFSDLLEITKSLSKYYTVFYNGPKCGASAPDHLHFQAGTKIFMPINSEFQIIKNKFGLQIYNENDLTITAVEDGLRRFISFESSNKSLIERHFTKFYNEYKSISSSDDEPMMNIICDYSENEGWRVIVFLREKHRSSHFFAEGNDRILISPASVDLAGVLITPREKDFGKISKKMISEIFEEITFSKENFIQIKNF